MMRIAFLAALTLVLTGFGSSEAEAQGGIRITPGNTCLMIRQIPNTCPRGTIALCRNFIRCTYRGRPSQVCTSHRCIPRL